VNVFFNLCRTIVVLVNPDPVALTEAYRKIVKLKTISPSAKLYVIINHAQSYDEGRQLYKLLLKATEEYIKLDFAPLGVIRQDSHIREAVLNKELLLKRYPRCSGTEDTLLITEQLLKEVFI
jgi:MinD-like ATPase involved in chromosome partitioning or flagellar assembly